jgi:hypothetical protein
VVMLGWGGELTSIWPPGSKVITPPRGRGRIPSTAEQISSKRMSVFLAPIGTVNHSVSTPTRPCAGELKQFSRTYVWISSVVRER